MNGYASTNGGRPQGQAGDGVNDLLERIAGDPLFGVTLRQLEDMLNPPPIWGGLPNRPMNFKGTGWSGA